MRSRLILFSFLSLTLVSALPGQTKVLLEISNPGKVSRTEVVGVPWSSVTEWIPGARSETIVVGRDGTGESLTVQTIDLNQDGKPDELLFQAELKAGETQQYVLRNAGKPGPVVESMTDARFVLPRKDLAWENDRIAFRVYGPALAAEVNNGIDVWTKRVRHLIVEKWYKANEGNTGRDSYHEDHGEGADFFSVGKSLGCGASALWKDNSLLQPGVFESHKILATGPIRTVFELGYKGVQYDGKLVTEVRRITLDAGQNLNKIEVTYQGGSGSVEFAAGVVKRQNVVSGASKSNHWVSLYGPTTSNAVDGFLGTGVIVPAAAFREIREDSVHTLIVGSATIGQPVTYYAGAGWTRSGDFKSKEEWERYLDRFAQNVREPLKMIVKR